MFFESKPILSMVVGGLVCLVFAHEIFAQGESPAHSQLCVIQSDKIDENSGVAYSNRYPDAIWTHNDSGDKPVVYLVSTQTGETLAEVKLSAAKNVDWEDIDSFQYEDKNYLLVADVGDNKRRRKSCQLYVFTEPELERDERVLPRNVELKDWKEIAIEFEGGPCNCEAIAADMNSNQIILLEKVYFGEKRTPGIYFIQLPNEKTKGNVLASRAGDLPIRNITAMALTDDGNKMVVRTYTDGYIYTKTADQTWPEVLPNATSQRIALPPQRQGEGVCFTPDESAIVCSSEFVGEPLWLVRLDAVGEAEQAPSDLNEPASK